MQNIELAGHRTIINNECTVHACRSQIRDFLLYYDTEYNNIDIVTIYDVAIQKFYFSLWNKENVPLSYDRR